MIPSKSTTGGSGRLDLFRLDGNRGRNQTRDPVDILVAVVRHPEPHHHQPRRGYDHDVLPLGAASHEEVGGMPGRHAGFTFHTFSANTAAAKRRFLDMIRGRN